MGENFNIQESDKIFTVKFPDNSNEAWLYIGVSIMYFFKNFKKLTVAFFILFFAFCSFCSVQLYDHYFSGEIVVKKFIPKPMVVPDSSVGADFIFFGTALAAQKTQLPWNAIVINGQYYGMYDPDLVIYPLNQSDNIIVYNKKSNSITQYEISSLHAN